MTIEQAASTFEKKHPELSILAGYDLPDKFGFFAYPKKMKEYNTQGGDTFGISKKTGKECPFVPGLEPTLPGRYDKPDYKPKR